PPNNPKEHNNVIALSPPKKEGGDKPNPELQRRRTDIHDDLTNVAEIREGIANRRPVEPEKKSRVRRRRPAPEKNPNFDGLTELEFSPEIPSIEKGKRGVKKVTVAQDDEVFADMLGATLFQKAISGMDIVEEPLPAEEVARKLLALRDDDLALEEGDRMFTDKFLLSTDEEVFMPVARLLYQMFSGNRSRFHLNDERIANLATLVRNPDMDMKIGPLTRMLENYKRDTVSNKRQPAHNAPKGRGRRIREKK
ncbi:MAG TPA: hypothetical protein PKA32_02075, partial [Candidatus Gracilibacteria bacterium]|nr:hypothetical protein [Candidatus Gracilibacteria bacterium]